MEFQDVIDEAARLIRDYPELSFKEAIQKAKEMLGNEESIFKRSNVQYRQLDRKRQ